MIGIFDGATIGTHVEMSSILIIQFARAISCGKSDRCHPIVLDQVVICFLFKIDRDIDFFAVSSGARILFGRKIEAVEDARKLDLRFFSPACVATSKGLVIFRCAGNRREDEV